MSTQDLNADNVTSLLHCAAGLTSYIARYSISKNFD